MKRLLMASAFSLSLCLLALSLWLLITPRASLAATGSASCGDGKKVLCCVNCTNVKKCDCTDGRGCTVTYSDNTTSEKLCSSFEGGPELEETAN